MEEEKFTVISKEDALDLLSKKTKSLSTHYFGVMLAMGTSLGLAIVVFIITGMISLIVVTPLLIVEYLYKKFKENK